MNADDVVVGGGAAKNVFADDSGGYEDDTSFSPQDPVAAKVIRGGGSSAKHSRDDDEYRNGGGTRGIRSSSDEILYDGDRPIRPKAEENYLDQDPNAPTEYPVSVNRGGDDNFGPGQHPLEGIPNFQELPAPEPLQGKYRYFIVWMKCLYALP